MYCDCLWLLVVQDKEIYDDIILISGAERDTYSKVLLCIVRSNLNMADLSNLIYSRSHVKSSSTFDTLYYYSNFKF